MGKLITSGCIIAFLSMSTYALNTSDNFGLDVSAIQKLTGQKGKLDRDTSSYKIYVPRSDLDITVNGLKVTPDMGLASWIAFKKIDKQTSVAGDLLLLQDQVNPVMSVALMNGLRVTDLHSSLFWESPRVLIMHVQGEGNERALASAIGKVLTKIQTTKGGNGDFPLTSFEEVKATLNPRKISSILGAPGLLKDGVYKVVLGQQYKTSNLELNKAIAMNSWAAFSGTDDETVVDGNIALPESELQNVLVTLRNAQLYIVAIYKNTMSDSSQYVFVHFWGVGDSRHLARALRSAFILSQNDKGVSATQYAQQQFPFSTWLTQNAVCSTTIKWAKELYPSIALTKPKVVESHPMTSEEMWRSGISALVSSISENVTSYTESVATGLVYAYFSGRNAAAIKNASPDHSISVVKNPPKKTTQEKVAIHVEPMANPFLDKLLLSETKNYHYVDQLIAANPVTFTEHSEPVAQTPVAEAQPNPFLDRLLASQTKDYRYLDQLILDNPITFQITFEADEVVAQAPQEPEPNPFLEKLLSAQTKNYRYVDQLVMSHPITFEDEKAVATSEPNPFLEKLLAAQTKDYHYVHQLMTTHPVIFDTVAEKTTVIAEDQSNPFRDKLLASQVKDYHYVAQIMRMRPVEFYATTEPAAPNPFLDKMLASQGKNYHYVEQLMHSNPVSFDAAPQQTVQEAVANQPNPFLDKLLALQTKNYHYVEQFMATHPVVFDNAPQQTQVAVTAPQKGTTPAHSAVTNVKPQQSAQLKLTPVSTIPMPLPQVALKNATPLSRVPVLPTEPIGPTKRITPMGVGPVMAVTSTVKPVKLIQAQWTMNKPDVKEASEQVKLTEAIRKDTLPATANVEKKAPNTTHKSVAVFKPIATPQSLMVADAITKELTEAFKASKNTKTYSKSSKEAILPKANNKQSPFPFKKLVTNQHASPVKSNVDEISSDDDQDPFLQDSMNVAVNDDYSEGDGV